ncbi:MAG TPA: hypothetical protein VLV54_03250 [Thermoanaerobaculia bacterium]|nr:hypothetical protein [Thermoanaerobaculia bacterium]
MSFSEILEAADQLSVDEQTTLIEVLRHRITERRRDELARDIKQARREFDSGKCQPESPAGILKAILS